MQFFRTLTYAERHGSERYYPYDNAPEFLKKKIMLLKYFMDYMKTQLILASSHVHKGGSEIARVPVLSNWFRSKVAIVIALSNGTIQINFFEVRNFLLFTEFEIFVFRVT